MWFFLWVGIGNNNIKTIVSFILSYNKNRNELYLKVFENNLIDYEL